LLVEARRLFGLFGLDSRGGGGGVVSRACVWLTGSVADLPFHDLKRELPVTHHPAPKQQVTQKLFYVHTLSPIVSATQFPPQPELQGLDAGPGQLGELG
jgi:hypothetical protein